MSAKCQKRTFSELVRLLVGPHGEFVSIQVMEMKASTARKGENRFYDPSARFFETTLRLAKIVGIEDHQRAARIYRAALGQAASQPPITELQ